jgi:hypothetical protein
LAQIRLAAEEGNFAFDTGLPDGGEIFYFFDIIVSITNHAISRQIRYFLFRVGLPGNPV